MGDRCPICKGTGKIMRGSFADPSKDIEKDCHGCRGTGELKDDVEDLRAQLTTALSARDTLSGQLAEARAESYGPKPGQKVCNCPVCKGDGLVGPDGECCGCVKMGCKDWHYKNPPTNDPRIREMQRAYEAERASNKALEGKPQ